MKIMKNYFALFLSLVLYVSCTKEIRNENSIESKVNDTKSQAFGAYPNLKGILDSAYWNGEKIRVQKIGNEYIWMGDIVFDKLTFDSLKASHSFSDRTYNPTSSHIWPFGKVYYTLESSPIYNIAFTSSEISEINTAIASWTSNTSLTFTPRTNQVNYIIIRKGELNSGNYSNYIGMKIGAQTINLEASKFDFSTVIHEIGHAIGFYHEQSRTDRDNYVTIQWNNIQSAYTDNFETYASLNKPGAQIGTFDFNSVMLYGSYYFSINPSLPTMTKLNGSLLYPSSYLSSGDIETSDLLYGPPFAKITRENVVKNNYPDDVEYSCDFYLTFYQDQSCTIPYTLQNDKTIALKHYSIYYQGYQDQDNSTISNTIFASGNSRFLLESDVFYYERHYDYGNIIYGYDRDYSIYGGSER